MSTPSQYIGILPVLALLSASPAIADQLWRQLMGSEVGSESISDAQAVAGDALSFTLRARPAAGLSPATVKSRLSSIASAAEPLMRGPKEARLYAELSPSVVMVVTDNAIGSGALIDDATIVLTNWHVVEGYESVGVIYKPVKEGLAVSAADVRRARVIRIDEIADLALLKVEEAPVARGIIALGNVNDVPVGSDVHAIGHPTGESWTYTKGFVSQIRQQYEWVTESGKVHKADVIQTQTPINPGNSGGPLLSDGHQLVGINSFKAQGEGLNFAVSIEEVRKFLSRKENRYARSAAGSVNPQEECTIQWRGSERSLDPPGTKYFADIDCDGEIDGYRLDPDDPSAPILITIDSTGDGLIDTVYSDENRNGQVDFSIYDTNADGEPDVVGYHRNGDIEPFRYEEIS